jgi:hypothetical protein
MSGTWWIAKIDSETEVDRWSLPGYYSQSEVEKIILRLVCTNLTEQEIIHSSLRKNDKKRINFLDYSPGSGVYGENPYYTLRFEP